MDEDGDKTKVVPVGVPGGALVQTSIPPVMLNSVEAVVDVCCELSEADLRYFTKTLEGVAVRARKARRPTVARAAASIRTALMVYAERVG